MKTYSLSNLITIKRIISTGIIMFMISVFTSCQEPADIRIQNNISQVKITSVRWGEIYMAYELLPGTTSDKIRINPIDMKLPASQKVSFVMESNGKSIYLETNEIYALDEGEDKLIVIDDSTKVYNPNQ